MNLPFFAHFCGTRKIQNIAGAILVVSGFLWSPLSLGHGEDLPGPHGGLIRMPGPFHTELVQSGPRLLQIYLLDLEWKNPVVKNSHIQVEFKPSQKKGKKNTRKDTWMALSCSTQLDHFVCQLPNSFAFKKGDLIRVTPSRSGSKGAALGYEFPFVAPVEKSKSPSAHSGSHPESGTHP